MTEALIRNFIIPICDACVELAGEECHTPECTFFLCSMAEVGEYLDRLLIRPVIDNERTAGTHRQEWEP